MKFQNVRRIIEDYGGGVLVTDGGERYHVYWGDTTWNSGHKNIEFDCGDEQYYIDGECIESVELPHSDRLE